MKAALPKYNFFTNGMAVEYDEPKKCRAGNAFTGSLGTDPQQGFVGAASFCYSVLLKKFLDGSISFIACRWTRPPYAAGRESYVENHETATFDGVEESLPLIEEWLNSGFESLCCSGQ